eukprot:1584467-Pleurochrysis_carterae.AAC.2
MRIKGGSACKAACQQPNCSEMAQHSSAAPMHSHSSRRGHAPGHPPLPAGVLMSSAAAQRAAGRAPCFSTMAKTIVLEARLGDLA